MKNLQKKFNSFAWGVRFKAEELRDRAKYAAKHIVVDEDGDTNFLSIIIILAIVLVLAAAFIVFKDNIVKFTTDKWTEFTKKFH